MRKILGAVAPSAVMVLSVGFTRAGDDDTPKKGRFKGKFAGLGIDKIFDKMDTDGDGKVSKEEFKKFFSKLGQGRLQGKGRFQGKGRIADKLFDKLDTDGDGFLSKEELKKLPEVAQQAGKLLENLKGRFGKNKKEGD